MTLNAAILNITGFDDLEQEEINHLKCHNVPAMIPLGGEHNNVGAMTAVPGISSHNLHHKVTEEFYIHRFHYLL